MNSITQDIIFKQSVVEYSLKHGVTEAAKRYKQHRKTIYRWREKYDGSRKSLVNKSRRPHSHPNQHTQEEIKMIKKYKAQNPDAGLVVLWIKLMRNGYTRQITSLYRVMQRLGIYKKAPSKKKRYEPKPYHKMSHPGERIQIDVKYVPQKCMSNELKELDFLSISNKFYDGCHELTFMDFRLRDVEHLMYWLSQNRPEEFKDLKEKYPLLFINY